MANKTFAVLTSGGDAPGMNACIRAIYLTAASLNIHLIGFLHGYNGLLKSDYIRLNNHNTKGIIAIGGTLLKSARCVEFNQPENLLKAANNLQALNIDCLIVIGGNGSLSGLYELKKIWFGQVIGIPGTIDNDLFGSDYTIGYQTAIDTAVDAIDKLRDTAEAFERIFLVEVMGRNAGFIALSCALASASEQALTPELVTDPHAELESIIAHVETVRQIEGQCSMIIVIAENLWPGGVTDLATTLTEQIGLECRPCTLGHIQRGGRPVAFDRILASKLGCFAVQQAAAGEDNLMVGEINQIMVTTDLATAVSHQKPLDTFMINMQQNIFEVYHG
ncbi:6-phosphofructokinase [Gayadomonas joobiniege]|uniref:6-phosphofructokinase n=1 Tax=Gayadomonas joobiniege TaxID=1234606 RepID=UPI0003763321|nr:ATP-dependent 6-phosphofructokinase [Gayadomonas joobiniege]